MLGTPVSYSGSNYKALGSQNNIWGPFVAFSDIFVSTNPIVGHKENLLSHLPYKRRRGVGGDAPLAR
jgi:hypothetical protein